MDLADSGSFEDSASTVDLSKGGSSRRSQSHRSNPSLELLDDFEIESELGRGGMGEVYLATERGLNRQVALKVLPAASRISATQVNRFLLEAKAAAQLEHDHIVPIYHVGECKGVHYFTMRYIEGCDLSQIIRSGQRAMREFSSGSVDTQAPSDDKPKSKAAKSSESTAKDRADSTHGLIDLSSNSFVGSLRSSGTRSAYKLAVSVALIGQAVAEALQHAHENGIVHRDIKPSNLMLDSSNKIWVTDFGLAQLQDAPGQTKTGEILGTLRYMSPEQASARPAFVDHRTDIYSLGVTLYELATLQKACRGESAQEILRSITFERPQPIRKLNPKLPRDLETIICKATERNPSDRYQTAADMAADLRRFANSESLMARRPSRLKGMRNWIWDRPAISAMGLGMLIVFAGSMFAVAIANQGRTKVERERADDNEKALIVSEGKQLQSAALLLKESNPGLGIAAGIAGAAVAPGPTGDRALMAAVDRNHEIRTIPIGFDFPGQCIISESGARILLCTSWEGLEKTRQKAPVIELSSGKRLGTLASTGLVTSAAFINNDNHILTFCPSVPSSTTSAEVKQATGEIQVWNGTTFELLKTVICGGQFRASSKNFSKATHQLAIPNSMNSVKVFDVPSFNQALVLPTGHKQAVIECLYSEDGSKIATWSLDGIACLFDARNGEELYRAEVPMQRPAGARIFFTSDSKQLCITGDTGSQFINLSEKSIAAKRNERVVDMSSKHNVAVMLDGTHSSLLVFNTESHGIVSEYKAEGFISDARLVEDDQYVAFATDEKLVVIDAKNGQYQSDLCGHQAYICDMTTVRGNGQVVSVAWDDTVRIWDIRSDLERRSLKTPLLSIAPVVMAQDEQNSRALVGTVRVSQSALRMADDLGAEVRSQLEGDALLVCEDGRVATVVHDGVTLWDLKTQRRTNAAIVPNLRKTFISKAIELPSLRQIALLTNDGELYFWNLASNILLRYGKKDGERIKAVALQPGTTELVLGMSTGELTSLNVVNWHRSSISNLSRTIKGFDLHKEKPWLLISSDKSSAFIWDLEKRQMGPTFSKPSVSIDHAVFVGDRVVTHGGLSATTINVWDAESGEELKSLDVQSVFKLAVDPSSNALAVATKAGAIHWELGTGEQTTIVPQACNTLAFVGQRLIVSVGNTQPWPVTQEIPKNRSQLLVWNTVDRKIESTTNMQQHVSRVLVTNDARSYLATEFTYGADYVDLASTQSKNRIRGHLEPLLLVEFGPSTKEAISVATDGKILLHSLESAESRLLSENDYPITVAAISNDRQILLIADQVNGVRQWDLVSHKLIKEYSMDRKSVSHLMMSADSKFAIAVVEGSMVKHWDLRSGVVSNYEIANGVCSVAISPDGQKIFVAEGSSAVYPAHPLVAEASRPEPAHALLINTTPSVQKTLDLDGLAVGGQFIDSGKRLAVLTTTGKVQVFDAQKYDPLVSIAGSRRFMQLLQGPPDSTSVYTASKNQVCVWNSVDGKLEAEIATDLTEYEAASIIPNGFQRSLTSSDYLVFSHDRYFRRPTNVEAYAKKIAPRPLTDKERSQLLESTLR